MKNIITFVAAALFVAGAYAQSHSEMAKGKGAKIKCAVMGGMVNIATATKKKMYADYKGNRYFFCCAACPNAFKKNPAKYANKPHIKSPKAK